MRGRMPTGPVLIFDDDHYYMGGVIAEKCREAGLNTALVTPAPIVSAWTTNTLESLPIARRLARLGVEIVAYTNITGFCRGTATLQNGLTGAIDTRQAASVITVTARLPVEDLFLALESQRADLETAGILTLARAGDCFAPSTIQQAVYTGHKLARGLDATGAPELRQRELPALETKWTRAA